ncbi:MAG TPA: alpha/beta hydrolase [Pirellulales bacterium]|nr:alpha/beta hydrolase [Pirellulales bacterium]
MHVQCQYVHSNGLRLHVATAGPADGPLVVLLHGFPEFWYGWRKQIEPLADEGFCVWAPDQRGYNLSDKPPGVKAYALDQLAADVTGLIDAAGRRQAILVGHDWGGAVAWHVAAQAPDRVSRAVILNVPHPAVMMRQLRSSLRQLARSWYIFLFQLPWLPERWLKFHCAWPLARTLLRTSRSGAFSAADLERYREAWLRPGAMTAMLNWYRAALPVRPMQMAGQRVRPPTLLIWGAQDQFLGRELAAPSLECCEHGELEFLEQATHWVQHEEPDRVNALIADFAKR